MRTKYLTWIILGGLVLLSVGVGGSVGGGLSNYIIQAIASAIATAEGYYVSGSRPNRNNNPGDLTVDTIGKGVGFDGPFVIYPDAATGWLALDKQVQLMFGGSAIYSSGMTIAQVAQKYTATDPSSWANTVAQSLGVTPDTTLISLLG